MNRRHLLKLAAGMALAAFGGIGYGFAWEPQRLRVARYSVVPLAGWRGARPLRIAALSDLHVGGPTIPLARVADIVAAMEALDADLVLLLGDFIASRKPRLTDPPLDAWTSQLAKIRSRYGIFAILGNHDWWHDPEALLARRGPTIVERALEEAGIQVLNNRAVRIETAGAPLWLGGLGDQVAFDTEGSRHPGGADDLPALLRQIPDDGNPAIIMAHEPDIFVQVPDRIALTLSGHTHGGQLRFFGYSPFVPSRYGNRFAYGQVREKGRDLIVSGGLGTSRIPMRLGVPPEILLVEFGAGGERANAA
ncbi:metallophosphoesterase [Bosea sp. ASV33]|uniref:metallophosphoesterase n=1 Tax=Bosea sp. ASV33 TaxID=2795106 RepID=UPI0020BE1C4D|nr:metallophosphoesterase [Bosea sp. ASV33]